MLPFAMDLPLKGFIEVANPLFIIGTNAFTFKPLSLNTFKDIDRDWMAHLTVTHKIDFWFLSGNAKKLYFAHYVYIMIHYVQTESYFSLNEISNHPFSRGFALEAILLSLYDKLCIWHNLSSLFIP